MNRYLNFEKWIIKGKIKKQNVDKKKKTLYVIE